VAGDFMADSKTENKPKPKAKKRGRKKTKPLDELMD
jgi:hypothetical protein